MNVKINTKTEEPLLSRIRIDGEVSFDKATPSRSEIQASIAKSVGKEAKLVSVEKIETAYGLHKASILSYVYQSEDMIQKAKKEGKKALEKKKKAEEDAKKAAEEKAVEEKPKEEAKPAEAKEESAKEEPKAEEAKAEEKPKEPQAKEENK